MHSRKIDVCLAPPLLSGYTSEEGLIAVVCDVLRATTTICAAFDNKVAKIVPVATVEEAIEFKKQGYFVAGERGGKKLDFADFGNSPLEIACAKVAGKTIVLTTTNGTRAIKQSAALGTAVIGSFTNLYALHQWITQQNGNVLIVCAGWENRISLEDMLFAGALIEELLKQTNFSITSDEAHIALDLWQLAKSDLHTFLKKASHVKRLNSIGEGDSIDFCFSAGTSQSLPIFINGELIDLNNQLSRTEIL